MPKFDPKEPPKYGQVWRFKTSLLMLICRKDIYSWIALPLTWGTRLISIENLSQYEWAGLADDPDRRITGWERIA